MTLRSLSARTAALIAADAAVSGGCDFRTTEEAVYDIIDSGMTPITAITHMDRGGIANLIKYWAKCDRLYESAPHPEGNPTMDQDRP